MIKNKINSVISMVIYLISPSYLILKIKYYYLHELILLKIAIHLPTLILYKMPKLHANPKNHYFPLFLFSSFPLLYPQNIPIFPKIPIFPIFANFSTAVNRPPSISLWSLFSDFWSTNTTSPYNLLSRI